MDNTVRINTLGGHIYEPPTPEEERQKIAEQELKDRLAQEALNDTEKRFT